MTVAPLLDRIDRFADLLDEPGDEDVQRFGALRAAETTGRPVGAAAFIADLERSLGRVLTPRKRGRKATKGAPEQPSLLG